MLGLGLGLGFGACEHRELKVSSSSFHMLRFSYVEIPEAPARWHG